MGTCSRPVSVSVTLPLCLWKNPSLGWRPLGQGCFSEAPRTAAVLAAGAESPRTLCLPGQAPGPVFPTHLPPGALSSTVKVLRSPGGRIPGHLTGTGGLPRPLLGLPGTPPGPHLGSCSPAAGGEAERQAFPPHQGPALPCWAFWKGEELFRSSFLFQSFFFLLVSRIELRGT